MTGKKIVKRKKEIADFAECSICGEILAPSPQLLFTHMAMEHPIEFILGEIHRNFIAPGGNGNGNS